MKSSTYLAAALCACFTANVAAQDSSQDCDLAERYFTLAENSLAEFDDNAAAGWLERAASVCPRFDYFQRLGEIRMQSLDSGDKASAVDAFIDAYRVAETDDERASALYRYASLLNREGEFENARDLVNEAAGLDSDNADITELAAAIEAGLDDQDQNQTVRALGEPLFKPLNVEAGDEQNGGLRAYPWPPEEPSWRIPIRRDLESKLGPGMSLIDVEELLVSSLLDAAYSGWGLYSAPGGFVMVTRLEAIDQSGAPLGDAERYALPEEDESFSLLSYVRNLFDAPEGYYRFIAFVVSDETYTASSADLSEDEALRRLRRGANRLPPEYAEIEFTDRHQIEALIYEFRISDGAAVDPVVPGRIPGVSHLQNSGLSDALFR